MQIWIHIGLPECGAPRLQSFFDAKRDQLAGKGVLYPRSPGRRNHTRLFMAVTDPAHVDPLRWNRGYGSAGAQASLLHRVQTELEQEISRAAPERLILSAEQFGASLVSPEEIQRLHDLLAPLASEFRIVAHVDEQARVLTRHYGEQIMGGRLASLEAELALAATGGDWRAACLTEWQTPDPMVNAMPEIQTPPFWLDYAGLVTSWEQVFGAGTVALRPYDRSVFDGPDLGREVAEAFDLPGSIGKIDATRPATAPSAAFLTRARLMNETFQVALQAGRIIPRLLWRRLLGQLDVPGEPIAAGSLHPVSDHFAPLNANLAKAFPALAGGVLTPDPPAETWVEAPPTRGFRASQYMTVFLPIIDRATVEEREKKSNAIAALQGQHADVSVPTQILATESAAALPPLARENLTKLQHGRFAPHNRVGRVNEEELAAPFPEVPRRALPDGSTGNVIVACMKNEGPYIVEWVAYHRAIGVDNFLIYTNGCEDGTDKILARMDEMGLVQHRDNDAWKGNSPQQHALNKSLKEPVVQDAEWIIHIDVDEFINVRVGDGTIADFLAQVPDATNVAMTWRLFGHSGITRFDDQPVIAQFTECAPRYCPKPHTVWGFKTMFRNIGAYTKISCHRPNKLRPERRDAVNWVNGSGQPMGDAIKDKGWRSEIRSIGYDMIQLNHYALRSAESFLVKRQRGRALHVDRTIGLNYWIRMDWNGSRDVTIQRNLPRLKAEMARLLEDPELARLHGQAVEWHKVKAEELQEIPEFRDLYAKALETRLTPMERVAYALALDMES